MARAGSGDDDAQLPPVAADAPPDGQPPPPAPGGPLRSLIDRVNERRRTEQTRLTEFLETHDDRLLVDLGRRMHQRDRESAGTVVGSAIAFRLFLFFVPMLLFLVGLAGFTSIWVDANEFSDSIGVAGGVAEQIRAAFDQPDTTRWVATILGLFGIATAGRALSKVLVSASSLAWRMPVATKASARVVGAIVGLIAGIGLIAAIVNRIRFELGIGIAGLSFLAAFGIYTVGWVLLSVFLPRPTSDPGALLPGAVLLALTVTGMQAVSQLYLPDRLGRASELYGAIGTTIVTLGWFFILGRAMVIGMALNAVIHERFGSISRVVFALPILRILPRRSPRLRRFFELDR